jgi:hypothetical protein
MSDVLSDYVNSRNLQDIAPTYFMPRQQPPVPDDEPIPEPETGGPGSGGIVPEGDKTLPGSPSTPPTPGKLNMDGLHQIAIGVKKAADDANMGIQDHLMQIAKDDFKQKTGFTDEDIAKGGEVVKDAIDTAKTNIDAFLNHPIVQQALASIPSDKVNDVNKVADWINKNPESQAAISVANLGTTLAAPVEGAVETAGEMLPVSKRILGDIHTPESPGMGSVLTTPEGVQVPVSNADLEQGSSYAKATGNGGGSGNFNDRLKDIDEARLKAEQDSIDKGKQQAAEDIKNTDINSQYTQDAIKKKYQDALKENPVDVIKQNRMLGRNLTPIEFQSVDKLPIRKDNYEEVFANNAKKLGGDPVNVVNDVRQRMVDVDKEWVEGMRYMYDNPGITKGLVAAISNPNRDFARALKSTNGFKYVWKDGWEHPEILEGGPNDSAYTMHENYAREHGWDKNQESYGRWFVRNGYIKGEGYGSPSGPRLDMIGDNPHLMLKATTYFGR